MRNKIQARRRIELLDADAAGIRESTPKLSVTADLPPNKIIRQTMLVKIIIPSAISAAIRICLGNFLYKARKAIKPKRPTPTAIAM